MQAIRVHYDYDQVEELAGTEPASTTHDLIFHHGDMHGRTAEGGAAQTSEQDRYFGE